MFKTYLTAIMFAGVAFLAQFFEVITSPAVYFLWGFLGGCVSVVMLIIVLDRKENNSK